MINWWLLHTLITSVGGDLTNIEVPLSNALIWTDAPLTDWYGDIVGVDVEVSDHNNVPCIKGLLDMIGIITAFNWPDGNLNNWYCLLSITAKRQLSLLRWLFATYFLFWTDRFIVPHWIVFVGVDVEVSDDDDATCTKRLLEIVVGVKAILFLVDITLEVFFCSEEGWGL